MEGGGINCSSPSGFVAVLLLVFSLLDLSSGKGCKTSEIGVALGVMEESDLSIIPASAACILEDVFSPCQRKSWVSFVQLPLLFHASSTVLSSCLKRAEAGARQWTLAALMF